jgi:putative aldouronate transport system permease protein
MNNSIKTSNNRRPKIKEHKKFNYVNYLKNNYLLYLFLVLPITYFAVFKYASMYGVLIAFKNYNIFAGIMDSPWVGLDVFKEIFKMAEFRRALKNTIVLNLLDLIVGFPAPILLAIALNEIKQKVFKKVSQTILYLPYFLSWVIVGGISLQVFAPQSGLVNILLKALGRQPIPFLTNPTHWIWTYVMIGVWHSVGWNTVIYLAAISGISSELYEAAVVDGAGRLRKIWHITLPGIKPTIVVLLILAMGRVMSVSFDRPFVLGNSLVYNVSDVISTFVYRMGLQSGQFNVATAVGLFQSVVGLLFMLITNFVAEKLGEEGIV